MPKHTDILEYCDNFAEYSSVPSQLVMGESAHPRPLVSIIIPTFKRPQFLREAVTSALSQVTDASFEVVVVDNDAEGFCAAEVDATIAEFRAPNLRLFRNDENIGMFGNWNRCFELARGRWVTILNDDDLLLPNFLATSLDVITRHPEIKLLSGLVQVIDERGAETARTPLIRLTGSAVKRFFSRNRQGQLNVLRLEDYFLTNPHHGIAGIIIEREAAINAGGFSPSLFPSADLVFLIRFQMMYQVHFLHEKFAEYRISVNESLKPELLRLWMQQGFQLRLELAQYINVPLWLLRLYAQMVAIDTARYYRGFANKDLDISQLLREMRLPNMPIYIFMPMYRVLLRTVFYFSAVGPDKEGH